MKIEYDKKLDTKYVYVKKGKITHTKRIEDWLLFDCNRKGEVLGVEILDASQNLVGLSTIAGKFTGYHVLEKAAVNNKNSKDQISQVLLTDEILPPTYTSEYNLVNA